MVQKMVDLRFLLNWSLINKSFNHRSFTGAKGHSLKTGMLCTVENFVLPIATNCTSITVDAVQTVVLRDPRRIVKGRFFGHQGTVVFRTFRRQGVLNLMLLLLLLMLMLKLSLIMTIHRTWLLLLLLMLMLMLILDFVRHYHRSNTSVYKFFR